MLISLVLLYSLVFGYLAGRNFRYAIIWLVATLPVYLIRFNLGPLPTTLLELNFGIIGLIWLLKYALPGVGELSRYFKNNKKLATILVVFFIASIAGILVSDQWYISLGQWRAYFLEPIFLFLILVSQRERVKPIDLIFGLVLATIPVSLVAILQKFSPIFYPPSLWDDQLFGRATSFFTTPNAIGLLIVPPLFVGLAGLKLNASKYFRFTYYLAVALGILAIIFSGSFGAILGVGAGLIVLITLLYSRRSGLALVLVGLILILLPPTRQILASKSASLNNRITLWQYSEQFFSTSPKNFVFGAGIRQFFRKVQKPHYDVKELERLIYPHNILLNFWSEVGLLGMLSFSALIFLLLETGKKIYLNKNRLIGAVILAAVVALITHGLVDVSYFKNDLAMMFWVLATLIFNLAA